MVSKFVSSAGEKIDIGYCWSSISIKSELLMLDEDEDEEFDICERSSISYSGYGIVLIIFTSLTNCSGKVFLGDSEWNLFLTIL